MAGCCLLRASDPTRFTNVSSFLINYHLQIEKLSLFSKTENQSQVLPVEEIVFDFIEECEITLIKVDSDIDVEEDMSSAGLSQNYILMKP